MPVSGCGIQSSDEVAGTNLRPPDTRYVPNCPQIDGYKTWGLCHRASETTLVINHRILVDPTSPVEFQIERFFNTTVNWTDANHAEQTTQSKRSKTVAKLPALLLSTHVKSST